MPRIGLFNLALGFWLIFFAASAGAFLATEAEKSFMHETGQWASWQMLLLRSAHGHTNLFGMLHVLLGLTFPYCKISFRLQLWETIGVGIGSFAMSFLLLARSFQPVGQDSPWYGWLIGACLSASLVAILHHACRLTLRLWART